MFCGYIAGFPCAWSTFNSRSRPTHRYVNLASGCFRAGFNAGISPNDYACAAGARTPPKGPASPSPPQGDDAAAWAKTEASASFWTIADATAPGFPSTHQPHPTRPRLTTGVVLGDVLIISLSIVGIYSDCINFEI